MRIMCIDYGDVRTGIAMTDPMEITTYGLETITNYTSDKKILRRIEEIVNEYKVEVIVLGMPYNENGTLSDRTVKTKEFMHKLKCKFNTIGIYEQDERYTSIWAEDQMRVLNVKKKNKKKVIDQLAAVTILRAFLKEQRDKI